MSKLRQPADVGGEKGLMLAVISRALADAKGRDPEQRETARWYLASPYFWHHLECLGLSPEAIPMAVLEAVGDDDDG